MYIKYEIYYRMSYLELTSLWHSDEGSQGRMVVRGIGQNNRQMLMDGLKSLFGVEWVWIIYSVIGKKSPIRHRVFGYFQNGGLSWWG